MSAYQMHIIFVNHMMLLSDACKEDPAPGNAVALATGDASAYLTLTLTHPPILPLLQTPPLHARTKTRTGGTSE